MFRTVTGYVADAPVCAPSVCAAGTTVRPCAGAIGVVSGLPDVAAPCADVTSIRSFTIDVVPLGSDEAIFTVNVTEVPPPAGTTRPLQLTRPLASVPPLLADTNDVLTGSRSVTAT